LKETNNSKTIINANGKILFFGLEHFKNEIAIGNSCFICGAKEGSKVFNDEHVIPDWILRRYNLHSSRITLPNKQKFKYGQYKIPCCKECNSDLGEIYEKPLSELFSQPFEKVFDAIINSKDLQHKIFIWINLIFLKTHLKDKELRINLDKRKEDGFISERNYWEEMHHIHCIARSHFTGVKIEDDVFGSAMLFKVLNATDDDYDYKDHTIGKTIMIQLGSLCIISVLNDACACQSIMKDKFEKMYGALTTFQIMEVVSHMNYLNINLKERPVFSSIIGYDLSYKIIAETPELWFLVENKNRITHYGEFLRFYVERNNQGLKFEDEILKEIENGKRSFLFDSEWNFLSQEEVLAHVRN